MKQKLEKMIDALKTANLIAREAYEHHVDIVVFLRKLTIMTNRKYAKDYNQMRKFKNTILFLYKEISSRNYYHNHETEGISVKKYEKTANEGIDKAIPDKDISIDPKRNWREIQSKLANIKLSQNKRPLKIVSSKLSNNFKEYIGIFEEDIEYVSTSPEKKIQKAQSILQRRTPAKKRRFEMQYKLGSSERRGGKVSSLSSGILKREKTPIFMHENSKLISSEPRFYDEFELKRHKNENILSNHFTKKIQNLLRSAPCFKEKKQAIAHTSRLLHLLAADTKTVQASRTLISARNISTNSGLIASVFSSGTGTPLHHDFDLSEKMEVIKQGIRQKNKKIRDYNHLQDGLLEKAAKKSLAKIILKHDDVFSLDNFKQFLRERNKEKKESSTPEAVLSKRDMERVNARAYRFSKMLLHREMDKIEEKIHRDDQKGESTTPQTIQNFMDINSLSNSVKGTFRKKIGIENVVKIANDFIRKQREKKGVEFRMR